MKEFGIELPQEKQKDFEKKVLENYKTVTDYDNQTGKLEKATKTNEANELAVKDLQDKLNQFKDVDVSALNQRIKELETEKGRIETEYQSKLADRDFNDLLKESIAAVNGKNHKAIAALLDMDTPRASKNQKEDITQH